MNAFIILIIVALYFLFLIGIAKITTKNKDNEAENFFTAGRKSPWFVVAFGMIGASLSGVTFISLPGAVGGEGSNAQFSYMQMALGYLVGYAVIALVLLPLYYKLQLTSIYTYLQKRFGNNAYKTGALFFLLSRTIGAAFRLFLVAIVFDTIFKNSGWPIPFWITVFIAIALIWLYTFKGGIKTIVWTDTLQTSFMLIAVFCTIGALLNALDISIYDTWTTIENADLGQMFFFESGWSDKNNFWKQFISGAFIAIVMTGLDQDMMQKNLSCKSLKDAQKNMFSFSLILLVVNFVFVCLGALLTIYAKEKGIIIEQADQLYPVIALEHLSPIIGIFFILGLVAAAYSSADSALTALTTSFCIDFLGFGNENPPPSKTRYLVHVGFSVLLFIVILVFWLINNQSVINALFDIAGYTYGPLLGLYSFGLLTKKITEDKAVFPIAVISIGSTYLLTMYSAQWFGGYVIGFEKLLINGAFTFLGLYAFSFIKQEEKQSPQQFYHKQQIKSSN